LPEFTFINPVILYNHTQHFSWPYSACHKILSEEK